MVFPVESAYIADKIMPLDRCNNQVFLSVGVFNLRIFCRPDMDCSISDWVCLAFFFLQDLAARNIMLDSYGICKVCKLY